MEYNMELLSDLIISSPVAAFLRPPAQSSTAQRGCSKSMRFKRSSGGRSDMIWQRRQEAWLLMVSSGFFSFFIVEALLQSDSFMPLHHFAIDLKSSWSLLKLWSTRCWTTDCWSEMIFEISLHPQRQKENGALSALSPFLRLLWWIWENQPAVDEEFLDRDKAAEFTGLKYVWIVCEIRLSRG